MPTARYWRVRSTDTDVAGEYMAISELQLRSSLGGADLTTGKTAAASAAFGGYPASQAIDDNASTFWTTGSAAPPAEGHWLSVDLGAGNEADIVEVVIAVRPDSFREDPRNLYVDYSSDGSTWTNSWSVASIDSWTAGESRTFDNVPDADLRLSKQSSYVAMTDPSEQITKQSGYVAMTSQGANIAKQTVYVVMQGDVDLKVGKQTAYVVCYSTDCRRKLILG